MGSRARVARYGADGGTWTDFSNADVCALAALLHDLGVVILVESGQIASPAGPEHPGHKSAEPGVTAPPAG